MKYSDEQIDVYLKHLNIDLLPYQREFLKKTLEHDEVYITMPPNVGRTNMLMLAETVKAIVGGREC